MRVQHRNRLCLSNTISTSINPGPVKSRDFYINDLNLVPVNISDEYNILCIWPDNSRQKSFDIPLIIRVL